MQTELDVSKNTKLKSLSCNLNLLTDLDLSKNTVLENLYCRGNKIYGTKMDNLVNSLPSGGGNLYVYGNDDAEGNEMTTLQVAAAKEKGWQVKMWDGSSFVDYAGAPVIAIDETTFPNTIFRNWILSQDYGNDGYLTEKEIASVGMIEVDNKSIDDLTGIELFTALKTLECDNNQLTALDLSNNKKLEELLCYGNKIHGEGMETLVNSLHQGGGTLNVYTTETTDGNKITTEQVAAANAKGWKVYLWDNGLAAYSGVLLGDANNDTEVNVTDIVAIVSHLKGSDVEGFSLPAADVNDDGQADEKDIELIQQMIMGK